MFQQSHYMLVSSHINKHKNEYDSTRTSIMLYKRTPMNEFAYLKEFAYFESFPYTIHCIHMHQKQLATCWHMPCDFHGTRHLILILISLGLAQLVNERWRADPMFHGHMHILTPMILAHVQGPVPNPAGFGPSGCLPVFSLGYTEGSVGKFRELSFLMTFYGLLMTF